VIKWKAHYGDLWEGLPVDVLPVSNGEFLPERPTPEQLAIMELANQETEAARSAFGMSRREFVRTAAAFSIGVWAINQITGTTWGGYNAYGHNTLTNAACDLENPNAQLKNRPGEFIFDVQSHHVDPNGTWRVTNPAIEAFFAAIWPQAGGVGGGLEDPYWPSQTPFRGGREVDPIENLGRFHYLKELYLDSSTNFTVLSAVPAEPSNQPLPIDEAALTVDTVKELAGGTQRTVMHAFVMPNRGSLGTSTSRYQEPLFMQEEFELMRQNVELHGRKLRGWKVYTAWGDVPYTSGWFLDDRIGRRFCEQVSKIGDEYGMPKIIAAHKGFALPGFDQRAASPRDVGPAARAFRDVKFVIYHSGYDGEPQAPYPGDDKVNSADRGVDTFVKSLRENGVAATNHIPRGLRHGNSPNVWAETGSVWRSVMRNTRDASHYMGKMIKYVGPRRICWGTDSLWYGSPQSEIVAFRSFEFSPQARELYDLPHGMEGDRWDPRVDCHDARNYQRPHPHVRDWPIDGKAHPERSIRNGVLGRNAAEVYQVDADAKINAIRCDDVQEMRDKGYLQGQGALLRAPLASNSVYGERTPRGVLHELWSKPWAP
jgi:predicted TIM-barrel fold metal-dependent hydrolase